MLSENSDCGEIEPYIPIWKRGKNEFIRYEQRDFDDGCGHLAKITVALFLDKNKIQQEMVAHVKWNKL